MVPSRPVCRSRAPKPVAASPSEFRERLDSTNLAGAQLARQSFAGRSLRWTNLALANLDGSSLAGADFTVADLREANLESASFVGVFLLAADFTGCNLKVADLKGVWFNVTTRWPERFDPEAGRLEVRRQWSRDRLHRRSHVSYFRGVTSVDLFSNCYRGF